MLATATVVDGRYVLGPVIGRGGGADVFRAQDTETGRSVAVKVLRVATGDDLRRFEAEADTLSRLDHPAIVRMCDRGVHDGIPYLVLDLIDGQPLSEVLQRGPLTEDEVMRIGATLADALAHAHALGIVHRDVKPGNVLVGARGDVHLTDFGIARLTDVTTITANAVVIGTAAYLAPEQVTGAGATSASDVYALGLVLVEALTAERAFAGTTASEAALARLHHAPVVPTTSSPAVAMLLRAMTDSDPTARPTSTAVADTLSADRTSVLPVAADVTTAIPVEPDPSRIVTPAPALGSRGRQTLIVAALVVGIMLLCVLGWSTRGGPAVPARTTPSTAPPATVAPPTSAPADTAPPVPLPAPKHGKKKP